MGSLLFPPLLLKPQAGQITLLRMKLERQEVHPDILPTWSGIELNPS